LNAGAQPLPPLLLLLLKAGRQPSPMRAVQWEVYVGSHSQQQQQQQ
jgi:hypothetical protein